MARVEGEEHGDVYGHHVKFDVYTGESSVRVTKESIAKVLTQLDDMGS